MTEHIIWYDQYDPSHKPLVGGKNASLGEMTMADLPVPPGFAVTTISYENLWTDGALTDDVNQLLTQIDADDLVANAATADKIRARIESVPLGDDVVAAITDAYQALCDRAGVALVPVAVRSSATAEDLPDASFAGQQDTYLWIKGADVVVEHVRKCWSSIFTDRAIAYRQTMGYDHQSIAMSVAVQQMVDPIASGVAFTLNPSNGDRSQIAIDASWGLGEAVVSGEVTPDNFLVDKVLREVVKRDISHKAVEYRLTDDGTVQKCDIEIDLRDKPSVTDEDLVAISVLARKAEKHYGCPQDVEWAIDRHLPEGENVRMLQSRPETVWSQKKKGPVSTGSYDPMASIVSTLVSPLNKKSDSSNQ